MDRLEEWRIFAQVASLRSFTRAATTLGCSPQAVTRAVAALEGRLGTRLLHRTTRSVSLSGEGERSLQRCRRALAEFDALESPADTPTELRGTLSITAPVLFGQLHIVPLVDRFLKRHPALDVRLLLVDRVVSLAEEGVDLGVRIGSLPDSALRGRGLGYVRTVICASPQYLKRSGVPRTLDALAKHQCIAFTGTTPIADRWTFRSAGQRERSVAVRARLVVNTGQAALNAAVAGLGLVRVLSYQVEQLVADGKLRIVLAAFAPPRVPVQLVHLPGMQTHAAVEFGELAADSLRALLA